MNLAIEKLPECHARVSTQIPADEVRPVREKILGLIMGQVKIPGFRPGKVPRKVVEQKFEAELADHTREEIVRRIFSEAKQSGLRILGVSKIDRQEFKDDGSFSFESEVVLKPEIAFNQSDYRGIEVKAPSIAVTDSEVQAQLDKLAQHFATLEPHLEEPAVLGDFVQISYRVKNREALEGIELNGREKLFENDSGSLHLSENEDERKAGCIFPGLPDRLIGAKTDDIIELTLRAGEDFLAGNDNFDDLKGVELMYEFTVGPVLRPRKPALDDEFARKMGHESLADLEEDLILALESKKREWRSQLIDVQIFKHLSSILKVELPQELVADETHAEVVRFVEYAASQGVKTSELESNTEEIFAGASERAVTSLTTRFMISEIARLEGLSATPEEVSEVIAAAAAKAKKTPKKMLKKLEEKGELENIAFRITARKTVEFLRRHASIQEADFGDFPEPQGEADEPQGEDDEPPSTTTTT